MRRRTIFKTAAGVAFLAAMTGAHPGGPQSLKAAPAGDALRIGLSLQPSNALVMVALERGYLADEGLVVSVRKYASGTRALRDGMFRGEIDVATASDVPIVLNSFARRDFRVIATIFQVDNQNRIVARADRGIAAPTDLRGKRMATQRGSAVHFFLHLFLLEHGIAQSEIRQSFMKAGALPEALVRGEIDAFSMREPYVGQARALLGDDAVVFAAPGLYPQSDQVVMTNDFLTHEPQVARKLLRALIKAEKFVAENAKESQVIVARFLGADAAEIGAIWPEFIPRVSLAQSLLLRFEEIGRWAIRGRLATGRRLPNYLGLIHYKALEDVRPVAVTVVR